jgi:hypothetical protein
MFRTPLLLSLTLAAVSLALAQKPAFQEDFESGTVNKAVWTELVQGEATLKIQSEKTAHGKYALQVHYPAGKSSLAFLTHDKLPADMKEHVFGRAYVFVSPKIAPGHTVLIPIGDGDYPLSEFEEIGAYRGTWQPSYQQNRFTSGRGEVVDHTTEVPAGKWFCLEWEFNDNPNSVTMWVDGEKVADKAFTFRELGKYHLVGEFRQLSVGVRLWGNAAEAFDVYYDDIALDTKRIGPIQ